MDYCQFESNDDAFPYNHQHYALVHFPHHAQVRYKYLLRTLLEVDHSVLFTGVTGVGKSVMMSSALRSFADEDEATFVPVILSFSAQTAAADTQLLLESKLEKKRKTRLCAPHGKKIVIMIDDINMPAREEYGAQPPIELLRQFQVG